MKWPQVIAGGTAAICGLLSYIASVPPELQNQIPMLFPENQRGTIGLYLRVAAAIAVYTLAFLGPKSKPAP